MKCFTLQVQVSSTVGVLSDGARVDLQRVDVVCVAGHHHIMPLIVIERFLRVSLHERRPVTQIKHIMNVPAEK